MSYGVDIDASYRRVAHFVAKFLMAPSRATYRSSNRSNTSWSSTSRPRRRSALSCPPSLLLRADEVIE